MSTIRLSSPLYFPQINPKPRHQTRHFSLPAITNLRPLSASAAAANPSPAPPNLSSSPKFRPAPPNLYSSLRPLGPFLLAQWRPILGGWLCSAVSVYCLSRAVPSLGTLSADLARSSPENCLRQLSLLSALLLARSAAAYFQQAFLWEAALNLACRLRVHVFDAVLRRDLAFFEGTGAVSSGDVAYRIASEAADVADTAHALLNLFAMSAQMLVISPALSLVSAMAIPCLSFVIAFMGERLRKISRRAHISIAMLSAYLNEVLPSMLVVKANNAECCESYRLQRLSYDDLTAHLNKKKMKALIPQITQNMYVGGLLIFFAGSMMVSRGSLDCSSMISFVTSLVLLIEPIQGVGKAYNELKQGEPAIERLIELTKFNSQVTEKVGAVDLDYVSGEIKFCDITFKYGDGMPLVLDGANLHIKQGEKVALVGPSGGGKSTITKLLLRLYNPLSGSILIDDNDIQDVRLESLRRHVGVVSQDITLFSGTVAENIGYRDLLRGINMAQVLIAAKIANADEFVRALPHGYETNIGQRGSLLSGGQKQRLAIARALYQNASILILDEATSALDSRSELLVRQALQRLMDERTVILIAHRMETVAMADRIILLNGGKLHDITHLSLSKGEHSGSLLSSGLLTL